MELEDILTDLKNGNIELGEANAKIRSMGYVPVSDIAKIDTFRRNRTGIMEAILAEGKMPEDVVKIAKVQLEANGRVLITRLDENSSKALEDSFSPDELQWSLHRTTAVVHDGTPIKKTGGKVAIISAGTADIIVSEEARMVAQEMGCEVETIYDVGVAGFHRLVHEMLRLKENMPDAIVVAAGREGTLPTVVSGLVDVPVIGLPVSTGYGAGANGKAALLAMLQSCSVLSVVNIDAGFVAGSFAGRIANKMAEMRNMNTSEKDQGL